MTANVKWFSWDMQGAPALTGLAGSFITLLDACLLNGFGTLTLTSLVVNAGVATATIGAGHAYKKWSILKLDGANEADLVGEFRVQSVTATSFTFNVPGVADKTATGTITAKVAAIGTWVKAFSGTNKAAYRSTDPASTGFYLRVNDDGTRATDLGRVASVRGYESMTDIDTGTGPFPTVAQDAEPGARWVKSDTASSASREWHIIGDGKTFYFSGKPATAITGMFVVGFGDIKNFKAPDPYSAMLIYGRSSANGAFTAYMGMYARSTNIYCGFVFARSYTGAAGAVLPTTFWAVPVFGGSSPGLGTLGTPCAVDGRYWVAPIVLQESAALPRGILRGVYEILNNAVIWQVRTEVPNFAGLPLEVLAGFGAHGQGSAYGKVVFDVNGETW